MIKAVIFDLDDTLISEKDFIESGFNVVSYKISNDFNIDRSEVLEQLRLAFKIDSKNVFNRVLNKLNIKYSEDYIRSLVRLYRSHSPSIKLYDDADEIIKQLFKKDYKLGIITDGYKISQRSKLSVLDIDNYFDSIIITDDLGREYWKPNKKAFEITKEQLRTEYNEMVYIGDNISKDFITPKTLGMKTICVSRKEGIYNQFKDFGLEYQADVTVTSLYEVLEIIENW